VQGLLSLTETGVPGWQELDWQVSFAVHALPSEHDDPFGLGEQVRPIRSRVQAKHRRRASLIAADAVGADAGRALTVGVHVRPRDGS